MIKVDAIGYSCPEPVIRLKKVIADHNQIDLLVDNKTSSQVCSRFALSQGFTVNIKKDGENYLLEIRK